MFKVGIITVSDKGSQGKRIDRSGPKIKEILEDEGYEIVEMLVIPDEEELIYENLLRMSDDLKLDLILTTGGTGFSKRDRTPEATIAACDRMATGIAEAIRQFSLSITPRAMLSRATSGIRKDTLIINLPGSPKAVEESLDFIRDSLKHGLEILTGRDSECGR